MQYYKVRQDSGNIKKRVNKSEKLVPNELFTEAEMIKFIPVKDKILLETDIFTQSNFSLVSVSNTLTYKINERRFEIGEGLPKEEDSILLDFGESIKFLDYIIKSTHKGLMLFKNSGEIYESNLGYFGERATFKNIELCKQYAIIYFIVARPHIFANSIVRKVLGNTCNGMENEFFVFQKTLKAEGIPMPEEITYSEEENFVLRYKNTFINVTMHSKLH